MTAIRQGEAQPGAARKLGVGVGTVQRVIYVNLLHFLVGRLRAKDRELDLVMIAEEPGRE